MGQGTRSPLHAATKLVLVAEPGAGKTTRAPRALLESELSSRGEILVLEPRRLATRLSAARVAEELGEPLGKRVGYTIRFDDVGGKDTRLRFVTEAVLTRRLVRDPELRGVSCVVLDELHERSLHADLALAFVKRLRETTRPDLRVLAMSATIDAERFARFLGCEVLSVSGRPFDVAIEHLEQKDDRPIEDQVRAAVRRVVLAQSGPEAAGHVLVFLPGAAEIRRSAAALEETARSQGLEVLPLHGDLPPEEQDRAVKRGSARKVILATNVAETSITIDGVVAVVDSGLERAASFSPWSGVGELVTAPICQASATQRAGRAGRTRAGRALRLYTKHDFDGRPAFLKPEIQRVDFCETRLFLARMGVTDAMTFPFFEAPSPAAIERAERTLELLGAIDAHGAITPMGRELAELPVHPRLGRVAIEAARTGHRDRGAAMAALLGEKEIRLSLRTRFGDRGGDRHAASGSSDALARLEAFEGVARAGGLSAGRIRSHDLDVGATLAAGRTAEQLARTLARLRVETEEARAIFDEDEAMLRALLAGYPDRVGKRRRAGAPEVVLSGGGSARSPRRAWCATRAGWWWSRPRSGAGDRVPRGLADRARVAARALPRSREGSERDPLRPRQAAHREAHGPRVRRAHCSTSHGATRPVSPARRRCSRRPRSRRAWAASSTCTSSISGSCACRSRARWTRRSPRSTTRGCSRCSRTPPRGAGASRSSRAPRCSRCSRASSGTTCSRSSIGSFRRT
jgi:ATP-dependent helicase HrpB